METMKSLLLAVTLFFQCLLVTAQKEGAFEKAFNESYKAEYLKNYNEAITPLMNLYTEDNYELNLRLGWLHYLNKSYAVSEKFYSKAVKLKPNAIEAKIGYVMPLSFLESWDKILQQYEDILKIDPMHSSANYWAGVIFFNRKKYETAAKLFEKVVSLYPFDYDANHMLAWTYLNLGKGDMARVYFNKALMVRPEDSSAHDGLSKIK